MQQSITVIGAGLNSICSSVPSSASARNNPSSASNDDSSVATQSTPTPTSRNCELVDDNDTFVLGVGGRVRIRPAVTVVVEWAPRLSGYKPGVNALSLAVERRAGGHNFQLSLSNNTNVLLSQVGRGGFDYDNWYLGFNISRKFY